MKLHFSELTWNFPMEIYIYELALEYMAQTLIAYMQKENI